MKEKPDAWMPFYIGDYKADTGRLRCEHHGAYVLLLFDYWRNGPPPDDDVQLASITCNDVKSWKRIRPMVQPFFRIVDGHWIQKRLEEELVKWGLRREKAIEKAKAAAEKRWNKDAPSNAQSNATSIPQALLEECPSSSSTVERASKKALSHSGAEESAGRSESPPPLRLVPHEETPEQELAAWIEALGKSDAGLIVNRHKPEMLSEIEEFRDFAHARIAELQPQEAVA